MQLIKSLAIAALASVAAAQSSVIFISSTTIGPCSAGKPCSFDISSTASGPITVILRKGDSGNLQDVETLSTSASPGTFTFTPKTNLAVGSDYAIQVKQGSEFNYSKQFLISGGTGPTGSSSSASVASSSSAATNSVTSTTAVVPSTTLTSALTNSNGSTTATSTSVVSKTTTGVASSSTTHTVPTNNAAVALQGSSQFALVFGAVAAFAYLN